MKATLHFDLDEHEDGRKHTRAVMSTDLALTVWDIQELIGKAYRAAEDDDTVSDETCAALEELVEEVHCVINKHNVLEIIYNL